MLCLCYLWSGISSDSRCTRWRICGPPSYFEEFQGSPTFSRETLFEMDVSKYARRLAGSDLFRPAASGPMRARVAWDHDGDRLVLRGGPALRFYRAVQRSFSGYHSVEFCSVCGGVCCLLFRYVFS